MTGEERRKQILSLIENSVISGGELAKKLKVSRQVIVQDIALLRAAEYPIVSTSRGYTREMGEKECQMVVLVHHDTDHMEDELNTIVDYGGTVVDVFVEHIVYGRISAPLQISSRRDVKEFMENIRTGKSKPLKELTADYHSHTIEAKSNEILREIKETLNQKGYLA